MKLVQRTGYIPSITCIWSLTMLPIGTTVCCQNIYLTLLQV